MINLNTKGSLRLSDTHSGKKHPFSPVSAYIKLIAGRGSRHFGINIKFTARERISILIFRKFYRCNTLIGGVFISGDVAIACFQTGQPPAGTPLEILYALGKTPYLIGLFSLMLLVCMGMEVLAAHIWKEERHAAQ